MAHKVFPVWTVTCVAGASPLSASARTSGSFASKWRFDPAGHLPGIIQFIDAKCIGALVYIGQLAFPPSIAGNVNVGNRPIVDIDPEQFLHLFARGPQVRHLQFQNS